MLLICRQLLNILNLCGFPSLFFKGESCDWKYSLPYIGEAWIVYMVTYVIGRMRSRKGQYFQTDNVAQNLCNVKTIFFLTATKRNFSFFLSDESPFKTICKHKDIISNKKKRKNKKYLKLSFYLLFSKIDRWNNLSLSLFSFLSFFFSFIKSVLLGFRIEFKVLDVFKT